MWAGLGPTGIQLRVAHRCATPASRQHRCGICRPLAGSRRVAQPPSRRPSGQRGNPGWRRHVVVDVLVAISIELPVNGFAR
jgi:hypothetical protein